MSKAAVSSPTSPRTDSADLRGSPVALRAHATAGIPPEMIQALGAAGWQNIGPPFEEFMVECRFAALNSRLLIVDDVQDGRTMLDLITWIRASQPGGDTVPVACGSNAGEAGW